ncbi:D-ribitol-5-phosphate phosphatase [Porphyromonas levii]|uniref:HAD family hydrolase n=1 Tax=Porphyromonas levii TaxID=28114 RepID=UPI001BAB7707|nr:HAD family phosphatase [Porphyromonas levii]MBR8783998.1 D-ribitol-5-phosphate phosphatase [Porphyromonas levii]
MIKNVLFDFGGVFVKIEREEAVRRLEALGVHDANHLLDPYMQSGIFLELEEGKHDRVQFTQLINNRYGLQLDEMQIEYALLGFVAEVHQEKFRYLREEWPEGIRCLLVSNINPFVWRYAQSGEMIDGGHSIDDYFEIIYASYQRGMCKPERAFFDLIIKDANIKSEETLFIDDGANNCRMAREMGFIAYCPENGEDWRPLLNKLLK